MKPTGFGGRDGGRDGGRGGGRGRGGVERVGARGGGRGGLRGIIIIDMRVAPTSGRIPWRRGVLSRAALECRVWATRGDVDDGLPNLGSAAALGKGDLLVLALVDEETAPVSFRLLETCAWTRTWAWISCCRRRARPKFMATHEDRRPAPLRSPCASRG